MRVLFDQGTPVPLRRYLHPHSVDTAFEMGWAKLTNGDLLAEAEKEGFDLIVTTDQGLKYQQNLKGRKLRIVVLLTTTWPRILATVGRVTEAIESLPEGGYVEVSCD